MSYIVKKYTEAYTMEKLAKTQELITPPIKITPPPPPPRTHLSKDSRLKHPFKASISRLAIHQRLPWKWNTLFPLGPKANLFLTARPNSKTNGTRSLSLWLLTPILIILAVIISSSCSDDTVAKSSQSEITELTVTINSVSTILLPLKQINAATVTIPYGSTMPTEITVTSAAISAKATGLAAGSTLKNIFREGRHHSYRRRRYQHCIYTQY